MIFSENQLIFFLRVQWFYGPPEPVWIRPSYYYPPLPPLPSVPESSRVYVKEGEPPRTYYRLYPKVQTVVDRPPQHTPPEESRARVVEGGGPPVVVKELVKTPPAISVKNLVSFFFSLGLSPYEEKPPLLWLLVLLFCFLVHHLWVCVCLSLLLLISHFLESDLVEIIPLQLASLRNKFTSCSDHIISACSKIKSLRDEGRETRVERFRKKKCRLSPSSSSNTQLDFFHSPSSWECPCAVRNAWRRWLKSFLTYQVENHFTCCFSEWWRYCRILWSLDICRGHGTLE
jgi:hypothetical protein